MVIDTDFAKLYNRRKNYEKGSINYELITEAMLIHLDQEALRIEDKRIK